MSPKPYKLLLHNSSTPSVERKVLCTKIYKSTMTLLCCLVGCLSLVSVKTDDNDMS